MKTKDSIKCPYCGHDYDYLEYLEVGDMSGEFEMICERCGQNFEVDFYCVFYFTTKEQSALQKNRM